MQDSCFGLSSPQTRKMERRGSFQIRQDRTRQGDESGIYIRSRWTAFSFLYSGGRLPSFRVSLAQLDDILPASACKQFDSVTNSITWLRVHRITVWQVWMLVFNLRLFFSGTGNARGANTQHTRSTRNNNNVDNIVENEKERWDNRLVGEKSQKHLWCVLLASFHNVRQPIHRLIWHEDA